MSRIFHVEDSSRWREQVRMSLEKQGLQVTQATGYTDAVATIDTLGKPPRLSLAIVDGNLGDGRGEQVIGHLRKSGYSGTIFSLADEPVAGAQRHFPKGEFSGKEFGAAVKNEVV